MKLEEQIAELEKLDSERTPGKWEAGIHPANERLNIVKPICFGKYVGKLPECEGGAMYFLHRPNAQIIAEIPTMMRVIRELQAREKLAAEALESALNELSEWMTAFPDGSENTPHVIEQIEETLARLQSA